METKEPSISVDHLELCNGAPHRKRKKKNTLTPKNFFSFLKTYKYLCKDGEEKTNWVVNFDDEIDETIKKIIKIKKKQKKAINSNSKDWP